MSEKTEFLGMHVTGTTEINVFHLKYEWKIVNYSLLNMSTGQSLKSALFSSEDPNIKWFLEIFPEGDNDASEDFVSLYLEFVPTVSREEITAKVDFVMKGEQNHSKIKKAMRHHFKTDEYSWGFRKFIKIEDLLDDDKLLPNDCLTIVCNITGQLSINSLPNRLTNNFMSSEKSMNFSTQTGYQELYENKELTDIVLNASDGKVLHAHKVILAAHSPVFLAMFTKNMKETLTGEVDIPDVQFDILQEVLRFIYCGTVENMEAFIYDILAVSNKYAIESLKFECEKYLSKNIKIDSVIEVLALADTYDAANLRKYAFDFFLLHKSDIVGTDNFKSFSKLQPHTIEELTRELIIRK